MEISIHNIYLDDPKLWYCILHLSAFIVGVTILWLFWQVEYVTYKFINFLCSGLDL